VAEQKLHCDVIKKEVVSSDSGILQRKRLEGCDGGGRGASVTGAEYVSRSRSIGAPGIESWVEPTACQCQGALPVRLRVYRIQDTRHVGSRMGN
jgi:hypothetical protein